MLADAILIIIANDNGYSGEDDRWHSNETHFIAVIDLETDDCMHLSSCGPFHTSRRPNIGLISAIIA